jgi:hypothetical protein
VSDEMETTREGAGNNKQTHYSKEENAKVEEERKGRKKKTKGKKKKKRKHTNETHKENNKRAPTRKGRINNIRQEPNTLKKINKKDDNLVKGDTCTYFHGYITK